MFLPLPHSSTNPTFASLGCKILAEKNPSCMTKLLSMTIINLVLQTKVAKVPSITLLSLCPHLGQSDQHLPLHWGSEPLICMLMSHWGLDSADSDPHSSGVTQLCVSYKLPHGGDGPGGGPHQPCFWYLLSPHHTPFPSVLWGNVERKSLDVPPLPLSLPPSARKCCF